VLSKATRVLIRPTSSGSKEASMDFVMDYGRASGFRHVMTCWCFTITNGIISLARQDFSYRRVFFIETVDVFAGRNVSLFAKAHIEMRSHVESRIRKLRFRAPLALLSSAFGAKGKIDGQIERRDRGEAAASTSAIAVRLETREAFSRENSILSRTVSARRLQTVVSDIVYIGRFATEYSRVNVTRP